MPDGEAESPRPSRGIGQLLADRRRTQSPSARTS